MLTLLLSIFSAEEVYRFVGPHAAPVFFNHPPRKGLNDEEL